MSELRAEPVTVLGLGAMGTALAGAFLDAGHPSTVWNRSAARAAPLIARGAHWAPSVADAVEPGRLVVICVLDRPAVDTIIDAVDGRWRDVPVVNLSSSTPEDARSVGDRFTRRGARYLDGTIMVTTELIGTADAHVLYSGDMAQYRQHEATLAALGGSAELLGADPGLAATYDLGMLDVFFTAMASFLHAAALVGADGVPAVTFAPYARRMLALLDVSLDGLAENADGGDHDGTEDNLIMELAFLDHIVRTSQARGLDSSLPAAVHALVEAAVADGHGRDSFSRIVDRIRRPGRPGRPGAAPERLHPEEP